MSVTKDVCERYTIHAESEYASICIKEWTRNSAMTGGQTYYCGEIMINSSFGSWGNIWGACGCPFKEFLIGSDFSYLFGKFMGAKLEVYDGDATFRELLKRVINNRRDNSFDADSARRIWDALTEREDEISRSLESMVHAVHDAIGDIGSCADRKRISEAFAEPWEAACDRPDIQAVGFWKTIWPQFRDALAFELKQQAAEVVPA